MITHDIIKECINNKREAQERLYVELNAKIYGVCLRYTKNIPDAQDCLQESFVRIFTKIKQFNIEKGSNFSAWATKIAINQCLKLIAKKNPLNQSFDLNDDSNLDLDNSVNNGISNLVNNEWLDLINKLPQAKRLVFNLHVVEGYSHEEIAEMLDISIGTSKSQLSKAKQILRERSINIETGE